ncbi:hypothetical protein H8B15_10235 [Hymenobacter sp. BT507]|uniref:Uncharacterized protein n=1 Tax=Hymenobacter citatus TaxID=2763506 RepID=A0ABR7MJQ4_9BACT|nr:hypothetical protein [Hymenobacter citatus]MBC6611303.1 hypothetical protein [Hymenobacter citatus]
MSEVLAKIDAALLAFDSRRGRPVAIELGERLYTQLVLDVAAVPTSQQELAINAGRPVAYKGLEILRDEHHVDRIWII